MAKRLKFRKELADLILTGKKDVTWRLFDDKDLKVGDKLELLVWETGEKFADADIISVKEKPMGEITESDLEGHEKFTSKKEMYQTYSKYYKTGVGKDTSVKIIKLKLI